MIIPKLQFNDTLNIAIGLNITSKKWKNTTISWHDFLEKLSTPIVTSETYSQFISATKEEQGKIKDTGGYVGGYLTNGRRDKTSVLYRRLVTLDIDFSHNNLWWDFTMLFDCAAAIHSTHKSSPTKPRHRLIIPLDRDVSQEEYQAIARRIAGYLDIDLFDQSTFDTNRLMFWPSISCDVEYYFEYQDGPFISADYILDTYVNWQDTSEWPTASNSDDLIRQSIKKQEDPESKKGIIGVFCRTYTIQEAIETFLSDIYEQAGDGRYTYTKGSTTAGLIIYEDRFAYSHHGTDPAGGRLCNAFDLVRIHKFGHLDTGKEKEDKERASFKAMEDFAVKDPNTRQHIAEEKLAEARLDFAEEVKDEFSKPVNIDWTKELKANKAGDYENSANNLNIVFTNDSILKGAFKLNIFDNRRYVTRSLPWRAATGIEPFKDVDYSGVRNYIECVYGIVASQKVDDALALEFERNKFHPIQDYLKSRIWDGKNRIDTLLIDYLGARDSIYTKAAIRKMLAAAVKRVFVPGAKFDLALILVGEQGTYKSTFIKKLGMEWFSDTFSTVQGKEAFEQIQGAWLIEMAELSGLKKAEVESIKHYITKGEDQYRPAYGRTVEVYKRQCVFFGTTNKNNFLRDPTGNRRFLPIDVDLSKATKSITNDLTQDEVDQIWAEAYQLYLANEPLFFTAEENKMAVIEQRKHSDVDERRGLIEDFLSREFPSNWNDMDLYERKQWLEDPLAKKGTVQKDIVCIAEIWCECLGRDKSDMTKNNTRDISDIMRSLPEWEPVSSTKSFKLYGKQRYYKRKTDELW